MSRSASDGARGGGRRAERARRRRARRRRRVAGAAGLFVLGLAVAAGAEGLRFGEPGEPTAADRPAPDPAEGTPEPGGATPEAGEGQADADGQERLLLATVPGEGQGASSLVVLAGPGEGVPASMLFVPLGTLVSVPGFGLERIERAQRYGGAELLTAAVENLLGVRVDVTAVAIEEDFADFLDRAGGIPVELDSRIVVRRPDGSGEVLFEAGAHELDGAEALELWQAGQDEMDALGHRRRVLEGLLEAALDETTRDRLVADGAPQLRAEADSAWVRELFSALSDARGEGALRANLLPVDRLGAAGDDGHTYQPEREAVDELVAALLGGGDLDPEAGLRAQVLNGVGRPGVGQIVDDRLPGDVRVTLTGNASRFDFEETRIIVYDEEPATVAAAERLRDALGVGRIQVSRQPQSVVDVTVIVGADLVDEHGLGGDEHEETAELERGR